MGACRRLSRACMGCFMPVPCKAFCWRVLGLYHHLYPTTAPAVATILLAVLSLIDDKHRLRSERLQPRANAAKGAVAWLAAQASQVRGVGLV